MELIMLIKYLLSKKYRDDYSKDLIKRFNDADEELRNIYSNIAIESNNCCYLKMKKGA